MVISMERSQKLCFKRKEKKDLHLFTYQRKILELEEFQKINLNQELNLNVVMAANTKNNRVNQLIVKNMIAIKIKIL